MISEQLEWMDVRHQRQIPSQTQNTELVFEVYVHLHPTLCYHEKTHTFGRNTQMCVKSDRFFNLFLDKKNVCDNVRTIVCNEIRLCTSSESATPTHE